jgi:acetyl esterase/lipase
MNMFHRTASVALLVLMSVPLLAAEKVIPLYEGTAPGSEGKTYPERDTFSDALQTRFISNVVKPTLTVHQPPAAQAVGTAVIICPGGGFHALAIDVEGHDVARALAAKGVTCFVLKYRLVETKTEDPFSEMFAHIADFDAYVAPTFKLATADGLAAVDHVRKHADEYGIKPDRIGIIGFSAGGMVSAAVAHQYEPETRPDFVASIYPGWKQSPDVKVPSDAPPLFVLAATDDQIGLAPDSVALYQEWAAARKPAELHLYAKGGHGFGMRQQKLPTDHWIDRYTDWLGMLGVLTKP